MTNMNLPPVEQWLQTFQSEFLPHLIAFFEKQKAKATLIHPVAERCVSMIEEFTLRPAKRIRPALLYYGYQCFAESHLEDVLKVAVFIEIFQTFLLIHDDIMDEAEMRRGQKTIHALFEMASPQVPNQKHHANAMAMLVGDITNYFVLEHLSDSLIQTAFIAQLPRVLSLYATVGADVCFGQALDMTTLSFHEWSDALIEQVYQYKTSRYTTELPLMMAAILADQPPHVLKHTQIVAQALGSIFQLEDDILGLFGDAALTGKSNTDDVREGKKTLLAWYAWQAANDTQKNYLLSVYGNSSINTAEIEAVRQIFTETGALKKCQHLLTEKLILIKSALDQPFYSPTGVAFLWALVNYMSHRNQ